MLPATFKEEANSTPGEYAKAYQEFAAVTCSGILLL